MTFKVGDQVTHNASLDNMEGTVIQAEGGPDGDLTEVFWPKLNQALWVRTKYLAHKS